MFNNLFSHNDSMTTKINKKLNKNKINRFWMVKTMAMRKWKRMNMKTTNLFIVFRSCKITLLSQFADCRNFFIALHFNAQSIPQHYPYLLMTLEKQMYSMLFSYRNPFWSLTFLPLHTRYRNFSWCATILLVRDVVEYRFISALLFSNLMLSCLPNLHQKKQVSIFLLRSNYPTLKCFLVSILPSKNINIFQP